MRYSKIGRYGKVGKAPDLTYLRYIIRYCRILPTKGLDLVAPALALDPRDPRLLHHFFIYG